MKNSIIAGFCLSLFSLSISAQNVIGKWKTVDDNSGIAKSVVEIYEENGKIYGKVIEIFNKNKRDAVCDFCEGEDKDKPVLGLVIIRGLEKDGDEYNGGKVLDPENGKFYKCYIVLEEPNKLKVRGYVGFSLLGRTQYWHRANK
ncbi:uncharacterized protein (DUF2147 family) [Ulvibacter sp. MAR_2010_11]|uniref:DUF2147 domain-containing protein n=1 Tax=Ulvibacter sp. MAR_2010_11 TaxID=1250229 RepID=UPI000C2B8FDA|nr:DUF2147 domain-containing protein [Ulvibacter sp. MAR_2010_11]PKA83965.1 uncharacterized protein (DUF2147 family) [Ulvibacter sp. MAR_2010_11]